jgi:hypothetical protein
MVGTDSYVVQAGRFDVCPGDIRHHLSRLSFDNSRVLSPWCSITLGSLNKDLLSLPCLFEQLTIAQKAGMIISAYQSIKIHSGKTFVYTSGLLVCLPIWRTMNWWRHTRTLYMTLSDLCIFKWHLNIYITVPCKHFGICEMENMFDGRSLRLERVCECNL